MIAAAGLLFAVSILRDAALRPSCDGSDAPVATVPAGTQVEVRFAVADGSNCYKIAATVDGKSVLGYVDGSALRGTDSFDNQRRGGTSLDRAGLASGHEGAGQSGALATAPETARKPRDAVSLVQAAIAAYQSDDLRHALWYCRDALTLTEDSNVAGFCQKVERETNADKSGEKLYGLRVALRYEGEALPADVARTMVTVLDDEFIRISDQLGCRAEERITAIVQSRESYLKSTNAAEWSAGLYDGRIHVPLMDGTSEGQQFDPRMRHTFAHETVHACLANIGRFPSWLHEGLAQKLSGDALSAAARQELQEKIRAGALPRLEKMGQDWSHLSGEHARLAYNLSLAAADVLVENYSNAGLRNVLRSPELLRQVTAGIDKTLGL
jgi:hypothetical protein